MNTFTSEQLAQRRTGIGASEVSAVLGLSSYKTPYDLWLEKTGQAEPDVSEPTDEQRFGLLLEDVVAREYARREGCKVQKVRGMVRSERYPWMFASPDRKRVGSRVNVQIKTTGFFANGWGQEDTDEVSPPYIAQVHQEMIVLGYEETHIPVLVAGQKYKLYRVPYNRDLAQVIIERTGAFWQHVVSATPPPPVNMADARKQFPASQAREAYADDAIADLVRYLRQVQADRKVIQEREEEIKTAICSYMGENEVLLVNGEPSVTWKTQSARRLNTSALKDAYPEICAEFAEISTSRVMRLMGEKG